MYSKPSVSYRKKRAAVKKFVLKSISRALITAGLLFVVFSRVDVQQLTDLLRSMNISLLGLAVGIYCAGIILSGLKWKILLHSQAIFVSLGKTVYAYVAGMFFNNFLPTNIGGDVFRAKIIDDDKYHEGLVSTLFDRYLGVVALSSWGFAGALFAFRLGYPIGMVRMAFIIFFSVFISVFLLLALQRCEWVKDKMYYKRLPVIVKRYVSAASAYRVFSKNIVFAIFFSFVFQFLSIVCVFVLARALNIDVRFSFIMMAATLTALFSAIPLSINGIGIREMSYVYFFSNVGISAGLAVALSFSVFAMKIFVSSAGGILFLAGSGKKHKNPKKGRSQPLNNSTKEEA